MTILDLSSSIAGSKAGARKRGRRAAASLVGRALHWLDAWHDRRHLHDLSDHTLRDMGFHRDQIDDVLRGFVRRP